MRDALERFAFQLKPGENVDIPEVAPETVFNGVLDVVFTVAGIACVIVIIIAGIFYAISDGDSNKIKTAKDAILYAVIGLVLIMMAFVITGFVAGRFA